MPTIHIYLNDTLYEKYKVLKEPSKIIAELLKGYFETQESPYYNFPLEDIKKMSELEDQVIALKQKQKEIYDKNKFARNEE